jgi:hypothetical protein
MTSPWTRPRGLINNDVKGTAAFAILMGFISGARLPFHLFSGQRQERTQIGRDTQLDGMRRLAHLNSG